MKLSIKSIIISALIPLGAFASEPASSIVSADAGADVVSRYVWRGTDFGNAPAIQPWGEVSAMGVAIGAWGSYSFSETADTESDLYISYSHSIGDISVGVAVTDYYYPSTFAEGEGSSSSVFESDNHLLEGSLSISTPWATGLVAYNFYNDDDNSTYLRLGVPLTAGETSIELFGGAATGTSAWYGNTDASFVDVGVTLSKDLKFGDSALPISTSLILNPSSKLTHIVFGLSL